jgi:hypothetical protein
MILALMAGRSRMAALLPLTKAVPDTCCGLPGVISFVAVFIHYGLTRRSAGDDNPRDF